MTDDNDHTHDPRTGTDFDADNDAERMALLAVDGLEALDDGDTGGAREALERIRSIGRARARIEKRKRGGGDDA